MRNTNDWYSYTGRVRTSVKRFFRFKAFPSTLYAIFEMRMKTTNLISIRAAAGVRHILSFGNRSTKEKKTVRQEAEEEGDRKLGLLSCSYV